MAAGYTLFCCSISHVHAHSFENAGLGTYFNKSGSLHCRCHYVGYHFLCGWENIQFILQQHYHLLLANMAIFGSILYIFTMHNRWMRLGILILLMAMIVGSTVDGSWTQSVFNYTPLPWMYRFDYLKYLFIVIPGSIAGEYLAEWMKAYQKRRMIMLHLLIVK